MIEKYPGQEFVNKAKAFEDQGAFESAESVYVAGIQIHPENYILPARLGALLVNVGRAEEAINVFKRALELKPDDPDIIFNMGLAFQANNNFDEALKFFSKAQEKGFDKGMVFGCFAEIYE